MSIGATTGKEPDYVDDADLLSLDEMRGAVKELSEARLSQVERATVRGLIDEVQELKKLVAENTEQSNKLVDLYQTLKNQVDLMQSNFRAAMTVRINGGSTTPEDIDGLNA